jgi:uncharacterized membrane protein
MIRTSSRISFAVLVHWVKKLVYLLYARLVIVSHNIISVFTVRSFLTGKVPRMITREVSQLFFARFYHGELGLIKEYTCAICGVPSGIRTFLFLFF